MNINHFLHALQRNVINPASLYATAVSGGGGATVHATGPVLCTLTNGLAANDLASVQMRRPVPMSGGAIRMRATMRAIGPLERRSFFVGFSNGYPTAGRDLVAVGLQDGKLCILFAVNGGVTKEVFREASFVKNLPSFDPTTVHTYELGVWPNGQIVFALDGEVVHTLVASAERGWQQNYFHGSVSVITGSAAAAPATLELYDFEVYSERVPAARLQNRTNLITGSVVSAITSHFIDPSVDLAPTYAEVERIKLSAGTGDLSYALSMGTGIPSGGTEFIPAGQKVGSRQGADSYVTLVESLGLGRITPAQGEVTVWERRVSGVTALSKNREWFTILADQVSLYASLQSSANGGTVVLSVDYSVY